MTKSHDPSEMQSERRSESALHKAVARFQDPCPARSTWQIVTSALPYLAMVVAMYWSLSVSYWLTLALAVPTAGFLIRVFIIFHDCGHGSFFRSRQANRIVGFFTGLLCMMPFHYWTNEHSIHHAGAGDLSKRGGGDIYTLTVREFLSRSWLKRLLYRGYRHPFTLLVIGPIFTFFFRYRFWKASDSKRRRNSTILTNCALALIFLISALTIGWKSYLLIQGPIMLLTGAGGIWLFYVQHQFENTYWERHETWSHLKGALQGSSFYKLPPILQWFTGNIGFHHVHHLNPRIPNYRLQDCHNFIPELRNVRPITVWESLQTLRCHLWDEDSGRLVSFADVSTDSR